MAVGRATAAARLSPNSLIGAWRTPAARRCLRIELYITPCIVTSFVRCDALVNPANERLEGTQFTPSDCSRYLAAGTTLLYPPQVIDGVVHGARGDASGCTGAALAAAIAELPILAPDGVRCPTGHAVTTATTHSELSECFGHVIHACAPFYMATGWAEMLFAAYHAALDAADAAGAASVAMPLLGAGARGAPPDAAAAVAAAAIASWEAPGRAEESAGEERGRGDRMLREVLFGVQHDEVAEVLAEALDAALVVADR